jgi:predicted nucleic acid-binding protein
LVTTTWILVEVADALSSVSSRTRAAAQFLCGFQAQPYVEVVAPTHQQFIDGPALYEQRPDKDWSLTDCIPFRLMEQRGVVEALTGDHHFEQAGFGAFLRG